MSGPVLISGMALAGVGTAVGLKKLDYEAVPQAGLVSAVFFVASLIHVPLGPASVHLILNGLVGLILGWVAFPVILVALVLQTLFFQFGGITTLGVNTVIMAVPALLGYLLFSPMLRKRAFVALTAAFACGCFSVFLGSLLLALALVFTEKNFLKASALLVAAHGPVMIVEGVITALCIGFLRKVRPSMLRTFGKREVS